MNPGSHWLLQAKDAVFGSISARPINLEPKQTKFLGSVKVGRTCKSWIPGCELSWTITGPVDSKEIPDPMLIAFHATDSESLGDRLQRDL
jgi:hypothetical protein